MRDLLVEWEVLTDAYALLQDGETRLTDQEIARCERMVTARERNQKPPAE